MKFIMALITISRSRNVVIHMIKSNMVRDSVHINFMFLIPKHKTNICRIHG